MSRPITLVMLAALAFIFMGNANAGSRSDDSYLPVDLAARTADHVIVETGDSLWSIAATHLDSQLERMTTPSEIAPYWLLVIDENAESLTSRDPDLIYPGEKVIVPAISDWP